MSERGAWGSRLWARLRHRWSSASREAVSADDERRSLIARGTTPISDVRERERVKLSGLIQSITYSPRSQPLRLIGVLYDGTGTIEVRWPGRRDIPGITVGRRIEVEGTAARYRDRLVIINPVYRLLSPEGK